MSQSIDVLGSFRSSLSLLTTYNSHNFHGNRRDVIRQAFKAIGLAALLTASLAAILCNVWFCINNEFHFDIVAQAMSTLLSSMLLFLMYLAFLLESRRISSIVDCLNGHIHRSE